MSDFKTMWDGMDYWDKRKIISKIVPRTTQLRKEKALEDMVQEKGRKSNYKQYHLKAKEWKSIERLLNESEFNTIAAVSIRAAACPMPLNLDVWDGLTCPFQCKYCFANAFRASLYTSFFDNSKSLGLRHCNPVFYMKELDKLLKARGTDPHSHSNDAKRAIAMGIPMRLGIQFEDFVFEERKAGISLQMLNYLADNGYPVMINTKSSLIGEDAYVEALSRNSGKAAVHITMISSDSKLLKRIEPGAPSFEDRIKAGKALTTAGVRVVARIEPFLLFINDRKDDVMRYMDSLRDAGIKNITFDTYSYSAYNQGIRQAFVNEGMDFDRFFMLGADSQALGSLLLGSFMEEFHKAGFSASTFDMGNIPINNQLICCEVGDWFDGAGWNWGSAVVAARMIIRAKGKPVRWSDFEKMVMKKGGFLSDLLREEVHRLWNLEGNDAFNVNWSQGIEPYGHDEDGIIWRYMAEDDHRIKLLEGIVR